MPYLWLQISIGPPRSRAVHWQCWYDFRAFAPRYAGGSILTNFTAAQITLTVLILIVVIFVLGFVADPIIGLYVDPWSYMPWNSWSKPSYGYYYEDDEPTTWYEHFAKGFASMGVLGFLKVLLASPFSYFRLGGGGNRGRTGRDRVEQVSWIIILIGVGTFLAVCLLGLSCIFTRH
jgi:hypothetical protein